MSCIAHGAMAECVTRQRPRSKAPELPAPLHRHLQRDAPSPERCASPPSLMQRLCCLHEQESQQWSHGLPKRTIACTQLSHAHASRHARWLDTWLQRRSAQAVARAGLPSCVNRRLRPLPGFALGCDSRALAQAATPNKCFLLGGMLLSWQFSVRLFRFWETCSKWPLKYGSYSRG